jgi:[ribosomal protein S18]-alanine N-acetyltransferase
VSPVLRPAGAADLELLVALEARCFPGAAWSPGAVAAQLQREDGVACLLSRAGAPLGYAAGWSAGGVGELLRVGVRPDARQQGHGERLLRAWEQAAAARGCAEAWLELRADNAPALALYRRAGWVETGRRARYYRDGEAAVLMARALGAEPLSSRG